MLHSITMYHCLSMYHCLFQPGAARLLQEPHCGIPSAIHQCLHSSK